MFFVAQLAKVISAKEKHVAIREALTLELKGEALRRRVSQMRAFQHPDRGSRLTSEQRDRMVMEEILQYLMQVVRLMLKQCGDSSRGMIEVLSWGVLSNSVSQSHNLDRFFYAEYKGWLEAKISETIQSDGKEANDETRVEVQAKLLGKKRLPHRLV